MCVLEMKEEVFDAEELADGRTVGVALAPPDTQPKRTLLRVCAQLARQHVGNSDKVSAAASFPAAVLPNKVHPQVLEGCKDLRRRVVVTYESHGTLLPGRQEGDIRNF